MNFGSMITVFNLQTKRSLEDTRSEKSKNGMWSSFWWNLQGSVSITIKFYNQIADRHRYTNVPTSKQDPCNLRPNPLTDQDEIITSFAKAETCLISATNSKF